MKDPALIEAMWVSFREQILPDSVPDPVLVELHRAFVAGSCSVFQLLKLAANAEPEDHAAVTACIENEIKGLQNAAIAIVMSGLPIVGHG